MKRVLLITEYLNPPYDEGIKKTVFNLFKRLDRKYDLCVICRYGFTKSNIHIVKTNPLFINSKVKNIIRDFQPEILIYFPFASTTFASYLRLLVFQRYAKKIKSILFALQPKELSKWQNVIIKFIKPTVALTPSPELKEKWDKNGINNKLLPLYTDLIKFTPLKETTIKENLRRKYKIPIDKYVISHMGHLNKGRNLESLMPLQEAGYQVLIVGSSSTPDDAKGTTNLKQTLLEAGFIIIDKYIENIEEIYQLSDLYIFPVIFEGGCIGIPLSILEARACGIPVLSTEFGSIKHFLSDDYGGIFYSVPENFSSVINQIKVEKKSYIETSVRKLNKQCLDIIFSAIEK